MATSSGRLEYVESIRGLACLMLVSFHVVGSTNAEGLGLDALHPLRIFNDGLDNSRMAIFAFISGFVLNALVQTPDGLKNSILSKARRLLIPMVAVSTLHYALRSMVGEMQQPFFSIFFVQYAHFWFLQSMFVLTTALLALSFLMKGRNDQAALILLVIMLPLFIMSQRWEPNVLAMYQGLYLAPFFYCGHLFASYLRRRQESGAGNLPFWLTAVAGVLAVAALSLNLAFILDIVIIERPWSNVHRLLVGLIGVIFLFLLKPNTKFLVWIGSYTYVIYLFHVIFTAGMRTILMKLLPNVDTSWFFVPCLLVGLTAPILVQRLSLSNDLTAMLFLGVDRKKKRTSLAKVSARLNAAK